MAIHTEPAIQIPAQPEINSVFCQELIHNDWAAFQSLICVKGKEGKFYLDMLLDYTDVKMDVGNEHRE